MDHQFTYPKVIPLMKGTPAARVPAEFRPVRPSQRDLVRASLLRRPDRRAAGR
jgi:hypothetical protein